MGKKFPGECKMKEFFLIFLALNFKGCSANYAAEEAALIAEIKSRSNPEARPENTTHVEATLELYDVNNVDIGQETMTLTGMIFVTWTDDRLAWNNSNIKRVSLSAIHVWVPAVIIENELLFGSNKLGSQEDRKRRLVVYQDGSVLWGLRVTTTISCSANIAFYPFDTQSCFLILKDETYTLDELDLAADPDRPFDLLFYRQNGEWELKSTSFINEDMHQDGHVYRAVTFELVLRRRLTFYTVDIMLPLGMVSLLMTFVFLIPVEMEGVKIDYCIAVMLTFIVYLTIVSGQLPHLSNQTSVIQVYIVIGLLTGTLSTLATIFVLVLSQEVDVPEVGVMKQIQFCISRWVSRKRGRNTNKVEESEFASPKKETHDKRKEEEKKKTRLSLPRKVDRIFCCFFGGVVIISYSVFVIVLSIQYTK